MVIGYVFFIHVSLFLRISSWYIWEEVVYVLLWVIVIKIFSFIQCRNPWHIITLNHSKLLNSVTSLCHILVIFDKLVTKRENLWKLLFKWFMFCSSALDYSLVFRNNTLRQICKVRLYPALGLLQTKFKYQTIKLKR